MRLLSNNFTVEVEVRQTEEDSLQRIHLTRDLGCEAVELLVGALKILGAGVDFDVDGVEDRA